MFLVIAYDIREDGRRLRVSKELERWGERTQFSVFECEINEQQAAKLLENLRAMCGDEDALRVYRLCAACIEKCEIIRGKRLALDEDFYQV